MGALTLKKGVYMNSFHKYFLLLSGVAVMSVATILPAHATPTPGRNQQRQKPSMEGRSMVSPSSNGAQLKGHSRSDVGMQESSQATEEIQALPQQERVRERARLEQRLTKTEVQQLQQRLSERLNTELNADGVMGPKTRAALRQYQQENNLLVTGRPDPETLESLGIQE